MSSAKWAEINQKILDNTDIPMAYQELGLQLTNRDPNGNGWKAVHAMGREDRSPSAAINVGTGSLRGRYVDRGGDGESMSLWDFAAKYGPYKDWREARKHYGQKAGLAKHFPKTEEESKLDNLDFIRNHDPIKLMASCKGLADKYGLKRLPLVECGGRMAKYPKKSPRPAFVLALPVYGVDLIDGGPVGYVIQDVSGAKLNLFQGQGKKPKQEKRITLGSSGLMGKLGIQNLDSAEVVYKVAGVSDMLALQGIIPKEEKEKHVVITNAGGETEVYLVPQIAHLFAGKKVVIIHDADGPGQKGAAYWVSTLRAAGVDVTNLMLPVPVEKKHGKDLRDWIAGDLEGHDPLDFETLQGCVESASELEGEEECPFLDEVAGPDETMLQQLGIQAVGEIEGSRKLVLFSENRCKTVYINDISKYKPIHIYQDFGAETGDRVVASASEKPGTFGFGKVVRAFATVCGGRPISQKNMMGPGVWQSEDGNIVLVGKNELSVYDGVSLQRKLVPKIDDRLVDFGIEEHWYEFSELSGFLDEAKDPEWCKSVLNEMIAHFGRWDNWKSEYDPQLCAALVMATWMQTVWEWRPFVYIAGPSSCGKSMLMQGSIQKMFGSLSVDGRASEAAIRQVIGSTSRIAILDEFEKNEQRQRIFNTLRTASRGGSTIRGGADGKSMEFRMNHIVWISAIETGIQDAADLNRFIGLDLKAVVKKKGDELMSTADVEEMRVLGQKALAVMMRRWKTVKEMTAEVRKHQIHGVDHRLVESYSLPCCVLGVLYGLSVEATKEIMQDIMSDRYSTRSQQSDEEALLEAIYRADVILDRGLRRSVGELLEGRTMDVPNPDEHLARYGLRKGSHYSCGQCLFISPQTVSSKLLAKTDYERKTISQILSRIDGAVDGIRTEMAGRTPRCIRIPLESVYALVRVQTEENDGEITVF